MSTTTAAADDLILLTRRFLRDLQNACRAPTRESVVREVRVAMRQFEEQVDEHAKVPGEAGELMKQMAAAIARLSDKLEEGGDGEASEPVSDALGTAWSVAQREGAREKNRFGDQGRGSGEEERRRRERQREEAKAELEKMEPERKLRERHPQE